MKRLREERKCDGREVNDDKLVVENERETAAGDEER